MVRETSSLSRLEAGGSASRLLNRTDLSSRTHERRDGMRLWVSEQAVESLLDAPSDTEHYFAYTPGLGCSLRSREVLGVVPSHVVETDAGCMLGCEGKGNQYPETPASPGLAARVHNRRRAEDFG